MLKSKSTLASLFQHTEPSFLWPLRVNPKMKQRTDSKQQLLLWAQDDKLIINLWQEIKLDTLFWPGKGMLMEFHVSKKIKAKPQNQQSNALYTGMLKHGAFRVCNNKFWKLLWNTEKIERSVLYGAAKTLALQIWRSWIQHFYNPLLK